MDQRRVSSVPNNTFFSSGDADVGINTDIVHKSLVDSSQIDESYPSFNAPEGLSPTRNYTDFTHRLPLTRIYLKEGMNYIGFPFDLDEGGYSVGYTLSDVLTPAFVKAYLGEYTKIGHYSDETGVTSWSEINWGSIPQTWSDDFTIDPEKGYVIKCSGTPTRIDKNNGYRYIYVYANVKYPLNATKVIDGNSGYDVLMPYWSLRRRYLEDNFGSMTASDIPKQIQDDEGRVSYLYLNSNEVAQGDLRTLEIGKAYLCKLTAGSTDWGSTVDSGASIGNNHHQSALSIPSYINDRPRKFDDDPTNWLYNYWVGIRYGLESHNKFKVIFDRLYTWSGKYAMGHRIKYLKEDNGVYHYRPLPPGKNDWIIAFTENDTVPCVVGAQCLNDIYPQVNIMSTTKLDTATWDPYNDTYHQALLGNPDKHITTGEVTDFNDMGAYALANTDSLVDTSDYRTFMGSISINMQGDASEDDDDISPNFPSENKTTRIYFMYYDSIMNKYYWLYSCDREGVPLAELTVTGENEYCHIGLVDSSGQNMHNTPRRQWKPIKGPVSNNLVIT